MTEISLPIASLTAVFAALLIVLLTLQVVRLRRKDGVVLGDNGDRVLAKAIRGHANATEQLPITLILMGLAELQGASTALLWLAAAALVLGRIMHATYFGIHGTHWRLRFYGMWFTLSAQLLLIAALVSTLL